MRTRVQIPRPRPFLYSWVQGVDATPIPREVVACDYRTGRNSSCSGLKSELAWLAPRRLQAEDATVRTVRCPVRKSQAGAPEDAQGRTVKPPWSNRGDSTNGCVIWKWVAQGNPWITATSMSARHIGLRITSEAPIGGDLLEEVSNPPAGEKAYPPHQRGGAPHAWPSRRSRQLDERNRNRRGRSPEPVEAASRPCGWLAGRAG